MKVDFMQIPPGLRAYLLVLAIFVKVSLVANDLTISPLRLTKRRHQLMLPILQNSMRLVCRSEWLLQKVPEQIVQKLKG